MRTYPLIRRRWSNEHIMAALFAVILLYLLPQWLENPLEIPGFLAVLAVSLLLDAAAGFLRYKKLVCSVSAAVTAGILQVITPDIPLWGRLVGIATAIILGKQLWGGTGKNTLNPAMVGYLVICIIFHTGYAPIEPTLLLIPALLLSLPFIMVRPFASIGLMSGMTLAMLSGESFTGFSLLVNSIFFGCMVITDPVTVTPIKLLGLIGGFAAGFIPLQTGGPALSFALCILIFNLVSYLIGDLSHKPGKRSIYFPPVIRSVVKDADYSKPVLDLSGSDAAEAISIVEDETKFIDDLTCEMVLERISRNDVYGCGGAAFPTSDKIKSVLSSNAEKKYFIINGVECDPGLIHDKWLLRNRNEDIYKGILAVCKCMDFSNVILAVKNTDDMDFHGNIEMYKTMDFYPAGFEKILIERVLKKRIPPDAIPSQSGILVLNVQTLISIYEAVYLDKKATEKYITVSDMKAGSAKTVKVKIGDSVLSVLEATYPGRQPVFTGGGVMQAHMAEESDVIEKATNFIAVSNMPKYKESPFCSNCGNCVANCPQGLLVNRIASLVDEDKFDEAGRFKPDRCISCGICSYVCPGGRNLSARVGEAKARCRKAFL